MVGEEALLYAAVGLGAAEATGVTNFTGGGGGGDGSSPQPSQAPNLGGIRNALSQLQRNSGNTQSALQSLAEQTSGTQSALQSLAEQTSGTQAAVGSLSDSVSSIGGTVDTLSGRVQNAQQAAQNAQQLAAVAAQAGRTGGEAARTIRETVIVPTQQAVSGGGSGDVTSGVQNFIDRTGGSGPEQRTAGPDLDQSDSYDLQDETGNGWIPRFARIGGEGGGALFSAWDSAATGITRAYSDPLNEIRTAVDPRPRPGEIGSGTGPLAGLTDGPLYTGPDPLNLGGNSGSRQSTSSDGRTEQQPTRSNDQATPSERDLSAAPSGAARAIRRMEGGV